MQLLPKFCEWKVRSKTGDFKVGLEMDSKKEFQALLLEMRPLWIFDTNAKVLKNIYKHSNFSE